jgi:hypothetical protein
MSEFLEITLSEMIRGGERRFPRSLLVTLVIFFITDFVLLLVLSIYQSGKSYSEFKKDCINENGTEFETRKNESVFPTFDNCSRGIFLGRDICIHTCMYQKETIGKHKEIY